LTAIVSSIGLKGLEGYRIQVEVQSKFGIETIKIVGLPDASVRESKQRVASALDSSGYPLTGQKITINLSPAELRKNGPLYDLPIAIGILLVQNLIKIPPPNNTAFIGALSLDGTIQPANGMLPAILAAKKLGIEKIYVPYDENLPPLHFEKIEIVFVLSLQDVIDHLSGRPRQLS
jgi:magnesium chelatase family protein